jgi:hypothetical protein
VRREARALAAAALVGAQVGACIAGSRAVVHELGPLSLTFLRYAITLASLLPFLGGAAAALVRLSWREAAATALLGIAQFGLLIALGLFTLRHRVALWVRKAAGKAQTAAGLNTRRGFATPHAAFLVTTLREGPVP